MPIYEYECPECGVFEVVQKFSDPVLRKCPNCKEKGKNKSVKKIMSTSQFHLKGSGWYATDYASKGATSSIKPEACKAEAKGESCACAAPEPAKSKDKKTSSNASSV